jgi:putative DNA primase/helicase
MTLATQEIAEALELKKTRDGFQGACPACGYATGFSLTQKHGKLLAFCHTGNCSWESIRWELQIRRLFPICKDMSANFAKAAKAKSGRLAVHSGSNDSCYSKTPSQFHLELWKKSQPAKGSVVEAYLRSRAIEQPIPETIRFVERAFHKPSGQFFPLMLAAVNHVGQPQIVAIHRTFLKPNGSGKADVISNKMMLGSVTGGSVHLAEPLDQLAVAEGLENALSVQQVTGFPTWAALSCHGLRTLVLPTHVRTVMIFADHDSRNIETDPGMQSAYFAAGRWSKQGLQVEIFKPPEPGIDFNDLLLRKDED